MKKTTIMFFTLILILSMLLGSCSGSDEGNVSTEVTTGEPVVTPEEDPAKHEISISEVESILAENGLGTNGKSLWLDDGASYHGGQQMRVCHTERGTYAAFSKDFGGFDTTGIQKFYVTKTDNDGKSKILYYGEFTSDGNEILVNIGRDIGGDIIVAVTGFRELEIYIFDSQTDEMKKYSAVPRFSSEDDGGSVNGYAQCLFDFENRKIYGFYNGRTGVSTGDYTLDWFVFDLETREWSDTSIYKSFEGIGRHCYLYPFTDGNGGAYILSSIAEYASVREGQLLQTGDGQFVFDSLELFHIPDLNTAEGITYVTVNKSDDIGRGMEGIWPEVANNNYGDVFIDADGYMHITYRYCLFDYTGTHSDYDNDLQFRHAVYKGLECVYSGEIKLPREDSLNYRPMVRQSTDGTLHLIAVRFTDGAIELEFYRGEDELGRGWKHEKHIELDESIASHSVSLSAVRDGSVQDNVLSLFMYSYIGINRTAHTFNISLEDYSITEPINILDGFDIQIDWRYDKRIPSTDHGTQFVSTDHGIYAAFVYMFDYLERTEYYHIVKIDENKNVTVLASDSFESFQDKYISISEGLDGMIYVGLPDGRHTYIIDPETDNAELCELTPIITNNLLPRQMSVLCDSVSDKNYCVSILESGAFNVASIVINPETQKIKLKDAVRYTNDRELIGSYDGIYTLSDGKGGAYLVGRRDITQNELGGKLEYVGYTSIVSDSIVMLYIPSLAEGSEAKCIDVHLPYEEEGIDGIWSSVNIKDVYLDSKGMLNILYSDCHFDYDDSDRRENPKLIADTLKLYHAIYDGNELVSKKEICIDGFTEDTAVRIAETADGTVYLVACNLTDTPLINFGRYEAGEEAKLSVYFETENGWRLCAEKMLGDFASEGLFVGKTSESGVLDCMVYTSNNDVCHLTVEFKEK